MTDRILGNRYILLEKIGQGGMGTVYRSLDRLTQNIVALKSVKDPEFKVSIAADEDDAKLALAREFRLLSSLRHPNIISVLDYGFDENENPYFTMNLLENPQSILAAGLNATVSNKIQLLIEILQALTYLHRRGILHRDLKPANVLVSNNQVKLLDFGLATNPGAFDKITGTINYIAPEVLRGEEVTPAADLYAFGIIAYQLFVGYHPFKSQSDMDMIYQVMTKRPDLTPLIDPGYIRQPPANGDTVDSTRVTQSATLVFKHVLEETGEIDELPRSVSPTRTIDSLSGIVGNLLQKSPEDRLQSANEVIHHLCDVMDYPVPQETQSIHESFIQATEFVGRDAELERLLNHLRLAKNGQGSTWLIGGASGIGKSRLLDELRTLSLIEGALVVRGQGARSGSKPYQIWDNVLRMLLLQVEPSEEMTKIIISAILETPTQEAFTEGNQLAQVQLFNAVETLFEDQTRLSVIIFEDSQWAHTEDIDLLEHILTAIPQLPILIVGSFLTDDKPGFSKLLSNQQNLLTLLPPINVMILDRFTAPETVQLVAASIP